MQDIIIYLSSIFTANYILYKLFIEGRFVTVTLTELSNWFM